MNTKFHSTLIAAGTCFWAATSGAAEAPRPNIIFILTDDLGYGDLGVFYQNARRDAGLPAFQTPNLDAMAAQGIRLTRHYCPAPVCAPSRASLLLGVTQGHSNVRDNQFDKALENNHTLGTVLQGAGYSTAVIGKWGLQGSGVPTAQTGHPLRHGFDYFFGLTAHLTGHYHYAEKMAGQTDNQGQPCAVFDGYTDITSIADKSYSTDLFTARAKKWIADKHTADPSKPFFLYLALTAPHAQLNVPTQAYPAGGGLTGGVQYTGTADALINTASGTIDSYIHPDYASQAGWSAANKRHATMIRRIDDAVGDLRQLLTDLGIADNTLIVFTSDNGPHDEAGNGGSYTQDPRFFRSYANMDGIKRDSWEGGLREPTIVCWPARITAGSANNTASQFQDWMPTFAELAGVPAPARSDGVSLVPTLTGTGTQRKGLVYVEYYNATTTPSYTDFEAARRGASRYQEQVIHLNGYKGIRYNATSHAVNFTIYDTATDPKETTALTAGTGGVPTQQEFKDAVLRVRRPNSTAARPYDAENVPPLTPSPVRSGVAWRAFEGTYAWVPSFTDLTAAASGESTRPAVSVRTRDDNIGLEFKGYLNVPADGAYTFYLTTDTGAFLRLHDMQVLDADFSYTGGAEISASVNLKAGKHPFTLGYRHATTGTPALSLAWSSAGITKQTIPDSAFYTDGETPPSPPTAADDTASTTGSTTGAGVSVLVNALANDTDDGAPSPLAITAVGTPTGGTAAIESGQIRYTPRQGFFGTDSFAYTISDGLDTDTAMVTVEVYAVSTTLWLPFDETSGTTACDAGGRPLGTLQNFATPGWTTGRWGGALAFDGTDDAVTIDSAYTPPLGSAARTATAWIKPLATQPEASTWLSYGVNNNGQRFSARTDAGKLRLEVQGGYVAGTKDLADGLWHHVAIVVSDANGNGTTDVTETLLYVDGVADTISSSSARTLATVAGPALTVGGSAHATNYNFAGLLDDVRLYPRALSADEVAALASTPQPSAKGWFFRHYGKPEPDTTPGSNDWLADADGNGLNALQEYAFGGAPFFSDTAGARIGLTSGSAGVFDLDYLRRTPGTTEATYQAMYSWDLVQWSPVTGGSETSADDPVYPGFQRIRLRLPTLINDQETAVFFKIQVQL